MFYLSVPFDFYSSGVLEAFAKTMGRKECLEVGLVGPCPTALDRKSTRLNSSHMSESRMPSSA
mgnify:CR=1 FL=1